MLSGSQVSVKLFCVNSFRENCYLLWNEAGDCVIVDPGCYDGDEIRSVEGFVSSKGLTPKAIWLTHGPFDHLFGVAELSRTSGIPVYISSKDRFILDLDGEFAKGVGLAAPDVSFDTRDLNDGDKLTDLEGVPFTVIATPGHTPGGVCFYSEDAKLLLCGDTLFAGAIGRSDLVGGDYDEEIAGIMEKLMVLPGDVEVLPGHGPGSSIAVERTTNPFLQPFNEPWEDEID